MTALPDSLAVSPGDLVWVPFPHVEDNQLRSRPALIVATGLAGSLDLCWALMITAAANDAWPEDIRITDHGAAGLAIPSSVRTAKVATLTTATTTRIGRLPEATWHAVRAHLAATLQLDQL